jgi:hypothetical protein
VMQLSEEEQAQLNAGGGDVPPQSGNSSDEGTPQEQ